MSDRYFIPAAMPRSIPTSCVIVKRPSFSYKNTARDAAGGGGREDGRMRRLIKQGGKQRNDKREREKRLR